MKLIDFLRAKGVEVPEKWSSTVPCSSTRNHCHDQWANIEVGEVKGLDKESVLSVVLKYWYADIEDMPENIAMEKLVNEIFTLQPTVKVMSEEELACLIAGADLETFKGLEGHYKRYYMDKARAIRNHMIKENK